MLIYFTPLITRSKKEKIDKKKEKIDPKDHMPIWLSPTNDLEESLEELEEKYDDVKFGFGLEEINKKDSDEATVCFTKGGKRMFFTQSTKVKNQYNPKRIYSVEFKSGSFGEPVMEKIPVDDLVDVQHLQFPLTVKLYILLLRWKVVLEDMIYIHVLMIEEKSMGRP